MSHVVLVMFCYETNYCKTQISWLLFKFDLVFLQTLQFDGYENIPGNI